MLLAGNKALKRMKRMEPERQFCYLDLRLIMELKVKNRSKVAAGLAHKRSTWKGGEVGMKESFQNIPHVRKWRALRGFVLYSFISVLYTYLMIA